MKATELKKGTVFELDGAPWRVNEYQNRAMGRGAGVVVVKIKNLATGNVLEKTFRSTDSVSPAQVERQPMQFLYREGDDFHFMNQETYEQEQLDSDAVGDLSNYMPEGSEVAILTFNGKVIGVEIPNSIYLTVTHTEPGLRGDTATAVLKPVTVETGYTLQAPLFINEGDVIKVDTRTGEYLERQK